MGERLQYYLREGLPASGRATSQSSVEKKTFGTADAIVTAPFRNSYGYYGGDGYDEYLRHYGNRPSKGGTTCGLQPGATYMRARTDAGIRVEACATRPEKAAARGPPFFMPVRA